MGGSRGSALVDGSGIDGGFEHNANTYDKRNVPSYSSFFKHNCVLVCSFWKPLELFEANS